jgi:hypothetical protein
MDPDAASGFILFFHGCLFIISVENDEIGTRDRFFSHTQNNPNHSLWIQHTAKTSGGFPACWSKVKTTGIAVGLTWETIDIRRAGGCASG